MQIVNANGTSISIMRNHINLDLVLCGLTQSYEVVSVFANPLVSSAGHRPSEEPSGFAHLSNQHDNCRNRLQNAVGHIAGTAATCTEDQICTECGEVLNEALGHNFGSWFVETPATTESEGVERRNCSRCNHYETQSIPMPEPVCDICDTFLVDGVCPVDHTPAPIGTDWTPIMAPGAAVAWNAVHHYNGMFIALASRRIITSEDGIEWTERVVSSTNIWQSLAYGNGIFVALSNTGSANRLMTSPDAINWTIRDSAGVNGATVPRWESICYSPDNNLFVAVASAGTNRIATSPNGTTWTIRTVPTGTGLTSVAYGNGTFVAVGAVGVSPR